MSETILFVSLLVLLQCKHFVVDYLLQPVWILNGKGDFRKLGGYVHAGLHVLGSLPAFWLSGISGAAIVALGGGEFIVHFFIDHFKAADARRHKRDSNPRVFWAIHGADQLLHHLTYSGLLLVMLMDRTGATVVAP